MTLRRAGQWLLDLLFPLYTLASTPERRRYWRTLPIWRAAKLFAAVFFILSGAAFFIDLSFSGGYPLWAVFLLAAVLGGLHIIVILAELRSPRFAILPMLMIAMAIFLFGRVPQQRHTQEFTRHRIILDATCLFVTMLISYRLFLSFATGEGMAHVAFETELSFAHAIQKTLVPPLSFRGHGLEAFGCTLPSAKVGGDLVDLVADSENVFAYLADVSGHGISAGIMMGMVKTAVRQALRTQQSLPALLESVNAVLPAVKEPEMYATLVALRFHGLSQVELALVGHPPVLHYRGESQDIRRHAMQQYPLGLVAMPDYVSVQVSCGPRDLFIVVTDGLTETLNAADQEFGLERIEKLIAAHATESLPEIYETIMNAVSDFGKQRDDRTVLLVRVLADAESAIQLGTREK